MLTKRSLFVFPVFLIYFNQAILAEELPRYTKPICVRDVPKWTDKGATEKCWSYFYVDKASFDRCLDRLKKETEEAVVCCEGYKPANKTWCVEDCEAKCKQGECDDDERCSCTIGFRGKWCEDLCPAGYFGSRCEHNCECLTSPECNPDYQYCKCNEDDEITDECSQICECRSNPCPPGLLGKNCTLPCPDGSYGQFCSKSCSCVVENTSECLKESGDCVCKKSFYGMRCERECTGILKCDRPNVCTCELTPEQKVELFARIKDQLLIGLACSVACLFVLSFLVYRYKTKSRRLKRAVRSSLRYSSEQGKAVLDNPIYLRSVLDDRHLPLTPLRDQTKNGFLNALKNNSLFNMMSSKDRSMNDKQANEETLDDLKKPLEENFYSTISDLDDTKGSKSDNPAV